MTRSSRAQITRIQGGNIDVAANAPAATGAKPPSPPAPVPTAAPPEESPTSKTPARTTEKASPGSSGNNDVTDEAPAAKDVKPPSPPALTPAAGAIAEEVLAQLTMSTEADGVSVDSNKYWVDVDAKKKKKTNVVVKPGPKPESKDIHWPGYCVEGCGCDVCVAKREEPSKTAMLNLKRVSKKPSTSRVSACLQLLCCNNCCNFCVAAAISELIWTLPIVVHVERWNRRQRSDIWRQMLQGKEARLGRPPKRRSPRAPCVRQSL